MNSPTAAAKHSLRALARRWRHLDTEVRPPRRRPRRPHHPDVADTTKRIWHRSRPSRRRSSSCSATTPNRCRSEAASWEALRHLPHQDKPAGIASTGAGTDKPTQRSTESPSYECNSTNPPSTTSLAAPPKASPEKDIIRCLKRFLARDVYQHVMADHQTRQHTAPTP